MAALDAKLDTALKAAVVKRLNQAISDQQTTGNDEVLMGADSMDAEDVAVPADNLLGADSMDAEDFAVPADNLMGADSMDVEDAAPADDLLGDEAFEADGPAQDQIVDPVDDLLLGADSFERYAIDPLPEAMPVDVVEPVVIDSVLVDPIEGWTLPVVEEPVAAETEVAISTVDPNHVPFSVLQNGGVLPIDEYAHLSKSSTIQSQTEVEERAQREAAAAAASTSTTGLG